MAVCVRLQLQNTEDKSRDMTQTCTTTSDEQFQKALRLFLAGKNTHLIAAVSSENCNMHT